MTLSRFGVVHTAPAQMLLSERLLLYSLVAALRPKHVLEIGTAQGGSALIIAAALEDVGEGELACLDPAPQIAPADWEELKGRTTLFKGPSPATLPEVARHHAPFDLVFIDGDHSRLAVERDLIGVLAYLTLDAYVLMHDPYHPEVLDAIHRTVQFCPALRDCGLISRERHPGGDQFWGGLYLLRHA